jgi:hypothetical protein
VYRFRSKCFAHPENLHYSDSAVAENLCMICRCAAIAETEGTCPGSALVRDHKRRRNWRKTLIHNKFDGTGRDAPAALASGVMRLRFAVLAARM